MHSFVANIRIFQTENSDVHRGEPFHINLLKLEALKTKLFKQLLFKFLKLLSDVQKNCIV